MADEPQPAIANATQQISIASYQVSPPEKFSFKAEEWPKWVRRFERFRKATGLDEKSGENQVNTLIYTMGEQADDVFASFVLTPEESQDYNEVKGKFEAYFVVKKNVIYERARFNSRIQADNESVSTFITDLHKLAEHCEFQGLKDELIRDRIVVGTKDRKLSEKMQLDSKLTLETATQYVKQSEMVKSQQGIVHGTGEPATVIDRIIKTQPQKRIQNSKRYPTSADQRSKQQNQNNCPRCLGELHPQNQCPARMDTCHKCNKRGHWSRACRNRDTRQVHEVKDEDDSDSFFMGEVTVIDTVQSGSQPWIASLSMGQEQIKFKLDSGADVTVIPENTYKSLQAKEQLEPTNKVLLGPCNYKMKCLGKYTTKLSTDKKATQEDIYVIRELERPLLGRRAAESLNLINRVDSIAEGNYKAKIETKYPKLFTGLGKMNAEYTIKLQEDAKPYAIPVPRKVPLPLAKETKAEMERMIQQGVISPVDEPTEWCAPMVVTPKPNGKVRVCVDLSVLNNYVQRENHPLPSVDHTLGKLAGSQHFSKLDANSGFWQITLAEESRRFTTFITPWGRYYFNVLPYGISSGSEKFQKSMSQILEGLEGVQCNIDDVLIHAATQSQHDTVLQQVLERLSTAGVTLNSAKCEFNTKQIKFLGHIISPEGIRPDPEKVSAVTDMPPPKNVPEVRTFLGMVNHLGKFAEHLTDKTKAIRELAKKETEWCWGPAQQSAFEETKKSLANAPILALYDPNKETKISADASSYGLGAVLLQKQEDNSWKPITFISRALTPTESRYAQIEKEALALVWACERCSDYIIGKSINAETDHKPLVPLLTKHGLDDTPPRIQRLRMRLMRFHIKELVHVPGKQLYVADTLSRMQPQNRIPKPTIPDEEMNIYIASILEGIPISDQKLQQVRDAQDEDEVCRKIKTYCQESWPERYQLNDVIKPYWTEREQLSIVQGILLKSNRIVIPSCMRLEVLDSIHVGHQGIVKCRARAREAVWWPGLSREIHDMVTNCKTCAKETNRPPEPLITTPIPDRPWKMIATDLFELGGRDYLLVVDYFSRFVEIGAMTRSKTSSEVIRVLKAIFARHGIPEEIRSDNGPQYASAEFAQFSKDWGIKHSTSSPRFPQANGEAERAVKTVKSILKKEKDPTKALLAYRATPLACGFSPAELLMGRKLRTTVPTFHEQLKPKWPNIEEFCNRETQQKQNAKHDFDQRHRVLSNPALQPNDVVYVKDMDTSGTVTGTADTPRSYQVQTPKGTLRRNRIHLSPLPTQEEAIDSEKTYSSDPAEKNLPSPGVSSRPKRVIKPSLKVRENLGQVH